jgi:superfamily II RNA helicase
MQYDPFQLEAIRIIDREESLIVSAPTGAGKTCIAEYAIEKAFERKEGAIYTSPIKALSNQKYRDFTTKYGEQNIGIITGDVSLNPSAPLLIMTTEIYRNSLFENSKRLEKTRWVIFDEIHYLDDLERGTVWEEAILFTPTSINILGLSATVPNIHELVQWMENIHEKKIHMILEAKRPVPLTHLFQCQGRILKTEEALKREGYHNRNSLRIDWRDRRRGTAPVLKIHPNRLDTLVHHLLENHRLPAIYFTFGRRRTEELALELSRFNFLNEGEKTEVQAIANGLFERYDLAKENSALEMMPLFERGIAFHHAGMLPTLKETVEQLFTSKLIKLIFTTETFALGINMPARTVIFDELRKFYGTHFAVLRTRDFYQMAGRAGRRGMDTEGFVYSRINPQSIAYPEVIRIIQGRPEKVRSQFNTSYATLLNLYRFYGRELLRIYPRSFHHFQSSKNEKKAGYQLLENKLRLLGELEHFGGGKLTEKGEFASNLYGYELMLAELKDIGYLEEMNELELAITLGALIFEPRRNEGKPRYSKRIQKLEDTLEGVARHVIRKEYKLRISPHSKPPHFHLGPALEVWMAGGDFEAILSVTPTDEGEIVRNFRMICQLLRQIREAKGATATLKEKARATFSKINRGIIDAERQLRS